MYVYIYMCVCVYDIDIIGKPWISNGFSAGGFGETLQVARVDGSRGGQDHVRR